MTIRRLEKDGKPVLNKYNNELVEVLVNVSQVKLVHNFNKESNKMNSFAVITFDRQELTKQLTELK